ncbi:hypothetical protein FRC09_018027, partial [Ceratobasidium sp. 395]
MDATIRANDKRGTAASGPGSDFGPPMSPPGSSRNGYGGGHRPSSSLTMKSDTSRGSHYTQAASSTHNSSWFNRNPDDEFFLERPSDEDIQSMFLKLGREFDVGSDRVSIDNKWRIIYESERKRWRDEKDKQPGDKRMTAGGPVSVGPNGKDNNGESYIQKFMTNTITPKDIQGLGVSLRTMPLSWLHGFIDLQGIPVLTSRLNALNRPSRTRTESETQQEIEILKCLKTILNLPIGQQETISQQTTVNHITTVLSSPHIPSRKSGLELVVALCYVDDHSLQSVLIALDSLSNNNNDKGPFTFWFRTTIMTLLSRGKMGSLVGTSKDFKKAVGADASLCDYMLNTLMLINGIIARAPDLKSRMSLRTSMEVAGVQQIIDFARDMGHESLATNLNQFLSAAEEDQAELKDQLGREVLNNLSDPQDIFQTIISTIRESPAQPYFLSALKHLLLIPNDDPDTRTKYYQVIDGLVTDIILERRASYAHEFGDPAAISFQKLAANFNEQERAEKAETEVSELRGQMVRLKYEKEKLDEELAKGSDGLVGDLKAKVAMLEEKLRTSRQNTDALQGRLVEQRRGYEERIQQLEMQILELFNMLKTEKREEDISVYDTAENGTRRKELVDTLTRQYERTKARDTLE